MSRRHNQRRNARPLIRVGRAAAPAPAPAAQVQELTPNQQMEQAELAEIIEYNEGNGKLLMATVVTFVISLICLAAGAFKENERLFKLGSSGMNIAACLMTCLIIRSLAIARDFFGDWVPQHERNIRVANRHAVIQQNRMRYHLAARRQRQEAAEQPVAEAKTPALNNN